MMLHSLARLPLTTVAILSFFAAACAETAEDDVEGSEGALNGPQCEQKKDTKTSADKCKTTGDEPLDEGPVAYLLTGGNKGEWHCAATLVSPDTLLTSASCVDPAVFDPRYSPEKPANYSRLVFFLADPNRTHKMSITPQIAHSVRKVVVSPAWSKVPASERGTATLGPPLDGPGRPAADAADLAMLVLDEPVKIRPMPLDPSHNTFMSSALKMVGFGGTARPEEPVVPRRTLSTQVTDGDGAGGIVHAYAGVGLLTIPKGFGVADRGGAVVATESGRQILVGVIGRRSSYTNAHGDSGDVVTTAILQHHPVREFLRPLLDAR